MESFIKWAPVVSGIAAAGALTYFSFNSKKQVHQQSWLVPAALSLGFLGLSAVVIFKEGPLGFWVEHTRNLWGNQIWFDLVFAGSVALFFLIPKMRKVGMSPLFWSFVTLASGSIGLLAAVSRLLYLQARQTRSHQN